MNSTKYSHALPPMITPTYQFQKKRKAANKYFYHKQMQGWIHRQDIDYEMPFLYNRFSKMKNILDTAGWSRRNNLECATGSEMKRILSDGHTGRNIIRINCTIT